MNLKDILNKLKALRAERNALIDNALKENRELTDAENKKAEDIKNQIADYEKKADLALQRGEEDAKQKELEARANAIPASEPNHIPGARGDSDPNRREQRDLNSFSFVKFMNAQLSGGKLEGIELEMSQEGAKEARNAGLPVKGMIIPQVVLNHSGARRFRNDMTATGTTTTAGDQGGQLIATEVMNPLDILHSKMVLRSLGATFMGGLVGNLEVPRYVDDTTAVAEKTEVAASNEQSPKISSLSLSPKRLPVFTEVTRQLLNQSSVDVENWLRMFLMTKLALRMETQAINGDGNSNAPTGILNTTGIGAVVGGDNGAAPDWADIVDLETAVAVDNADIGALAFLTNPKVRGKLLQTAKVASTDSKMVWDDGQFPLRGYRAEVSNIVPSTLTKGSSTSVCSAIIFGNFADLLIGQWGGMDVLVNPYSRDTEGIVRVNVATFYDCGVARAESFAAMKDALTA